MIISSTQIAAAANKFRLDVQQPSVNGLHYEDNLTSCLFVLMQSLRWTPRVRVVRADTNLKPCQSYPKYMHEFICRLGWKQGELTVTLNSATRSPEHYRHLIAERLVPVILNFSQLARRSALPEGEWSMAIGDGSFWNAISYSSDGAGVLITDPHYICSAGYQQQRVDFSFAPLWNDRIGKVFWRGIGSGIKRYWPPVGDGDFNWLPRLQLCDLARRSHQSERMDCAVTEIVQIPAENAHLADFVRTSGLLASHVPKIDFAKYKAVIDIDGNSNAWSGLMTSLLTGSCVLKVGSEHGFRQWYYGRLEPWRHYIPVSSDFSDLEDRIEFVHSNDKIAREIGEEGRSFALELDVTAEIGRCSSDLETWL